VDGAWDVLSGGDVAVAVVAVVAIELTAQLLGIGGGSVLAAVMHLGLAQLQGL
jgi:hypothetical protein